MSPSPRLKHSSREFSTSSLNNMKHLPRHVREPVASVAWGLSANAAAYCYFIMGCRAAIN